MLQLVVVVQRSFFDNHDKLKHIGHKNQIFKDSSYS